MGFEPGDIVQRYASLASSLIERWSAMASEAAAKLDAGEYDFVSAAEDLTDGLALATEGGLQWAAEAFEVYANTGSVQSGPEIVTSEPFRAPAGAALTLAGPLTKGAGLDQLPVSVVSIQPPQLGPAETEFTLRANAAGHRGATYVGSVNASTDAGATVVNVWLTVP